MFHMFEHKTVLLEEAVELLNIKENGIYVDATTGGGGHSSLILSKLKSGHLYCFDQDEYAFTRTKERLEAIGKNYTFIHANFVHLKKELEKLNITNIDGIIYDLGVSSFQLDIQERGFSYRLDAPLDMRMDQTQELTAYKIVNEYPYEELVRILYRYGEEAFAKQISRGIERRQEKPIQTTLELVEVIKQSLPQKVLKQKGHPAKQTFQALRIAVNDELRVFEDSIHDALDLLNPQGRAVVITFHSLEDRICKTVFKEKSSVSLPPKGVPIIVKEEAPFELVTKKPLLPSAMELQQNNRAHSAKMRVIEKK